MGFFKLTGIEVSFCISITHVVGQAFASDRCGSSCSNEVIHGNYSGASLRKCSYWSPSSENGHSHFHQCGPYHKPDTLYPKISLNYTDSLTTLTGHWDLSCCCVGRTEPTSTLWIQWETEFSNLSSSTLKSSWVRIQALSVWLRVCEHHKATIPMDEIGKVAIS
jgi:hypothetical protein